jgi:hypothetical protein
MGLFWDLPKVHPWLHPPRKSKYIPARAVLYCKRQKGDKMKSTPLWKKVSTAILLAVVLGGTGAAVGGCAYGGIASTPDGTIVLTRNGLLGLLRKVYVCKVAGAVLTCTETVAP